MVVHSVSGDGEALPQGSEDKAQRTLSLTSTVLSRQAVILDFGGTLLSSLSAERAPTTFLAYRDLSAAGDACSAGFRLLQVGQRWQ